jgi:Fasciclin domain
MAANSMTPAFCYLLIVSAAAFDIAEILKSESNDYTTFTKLLTDTKLADEINNRQTITVLALNNGAIGAITSLPSNLQKKVLSLHVILDYYDPIKLNALKQKTTLLTTLFQASGQATGQMGFLNYTELSNEKQVFGSAVPGAPLDSNLITVVAARPYNISVIEVSKAIIPPGLDGAAKSPSTPPSNASAPATPPTSTQKPSQAPENATKPPVGSTTPSSSNATAPSSSNATTPSPKSAPVPSESANAPNSNDTSSPTDSKATPPTDASSPSAGGETPPASGDQITPTEAPSGGATQAPTAADDPAEAEGPVTDSSANASSPAATDVSDSPAAGGPTDASSGNAGSDKTSSAGTIMIRTSLRLVAMGLVFIGAL